MTEIDRIITLIDSYLETKGLEHVEPNEVSLYLEKHEILSYSTKGQPLRKLLREGLIPNALKISGRWEIRHSNNNRIKTLSNKKAIIEKNHSIVNIVKGFAPIADSSSQILILGTLPGSISLQKGEYYASPNNHFWKIIAELFNETLLLSYDARVTMLKKHHIALWDVLCSANREGSLDADIKNPVANDIVGFITTHPSLQKFEEKKKHWSSILKYE